MIPVGTIGDLYIRGCLSLSRSDYGTKIKEDYPKCYTDPRSTRLGSTTDQLERNNTTIKIFIELPLELGCVTCTSIIGTCNYLEVSVSHEDSAISHPRDQVYLSLRVGKGSEVELQQALPYMVANIRKREREEKQRTVESLEVIKK